MTAAISTKRSPKRRRRILPGTRQALRTPDPKDNEDTVTESEKDKEKRIERLITINRGAHNQIADRIQVLFDLVDDYSSEMVRL